MVAGFSRLGERFPFPDLRTANGVEGASLPPTACGAGPPGAEPAAPRQEQDALTGKALRLLPAAPSAQRRARRLSDRAARGAPAKEVSVASFPWCNACPQGSENACPGEHDP